MYDARIRPGFVPASRLSVFSNFAGLEVDGCPLRNIPERTNGRWGDGLTAADMEKCVG